MINGMVFSLFLPCFHRSIGRKKGTVNRLRRAVHAIVAPVPQSDALAATLSLKESQ
jgi:hypothetical protein